MHIRAHSDNNIYLSLLWSDLSKTTTRACHSKAEVNFVSRADLWSYAAKVAVEFSVEQNNYQCDDNPGDWAGNYVGPAQDCLRNKGASDCKVK